MEIVAMDLSDSHNRLRFYHELQSYVNWSNEDVERVVLAGPLTHDSFPELIDDFYEEISRHSTTASVISGGDAQIERLKQTLVGWLNDLFSGNYDAEFVERRWRVGFRHVQIGLDQAFATIALGRLRVGLTHRISQSWTSDDPIAPTLESVNKLLDLESAIINAAYHAHHTKQLQQQSKRQMEQTARLAAIGQMITGLAHESRNALQRSHACLATLMLDIGEMPDAMKQANRIQSALDHLQLLYEEVRNYAAPIKLDLVTISMTRLLQNVWNHLENEWRPKNHQFELNNECASECMVDVDRSRVEQIFTNLFQNAIDASKENDFVHCSLRPVDLPERENAYLEIVVQDHGKGIDELSIDRIFEPFFTTKTKGTGLGLAIARRIIEKHKGTISVTSKLGQGTRFELHLPFSVSRRN